MDALDMLYPELSEEAKQEAQALIEQFKQRMSKVAEEVISDFYTNVVPYIESDSWTNFRNELLDGLKNYNNAKIQCKYDFKRVREVILSEHEKEVIADINQDLLEQNEELKKRIEDLQYTRERYR